jgi:hypothetical protein
MTHFLAFISGMIVGAFLVIVWAACAAAGMASDAESGLTRVPLVKLRRDGE